MKPAILKTFHNDTTSDCRKESFDIAKKKIADT